MGGAASDIVLRYAEGGGPRRVDGEAGMRGERGNAGDRGDLRMDGGAKKGDRGGRVAEPGAGLSGLYIKVRDRAQ